MGEYNYMSEKDKDKLFQLALDVKKHEEYQEKLKEKTNCYIREYPYAKIIDYFILTQCLFNLLCKLYFDKRTEQGKKLNLAVAIVYCVYSEHSFCDILGTKYTQDLIIIIKALYDFMEKTDKSIIKENWSGVENIAEMVKTFSENIEDIICEEVFRKAEEFIKNL